MILDNIFGHLVTLLIVLITTLNEVKCLRLLEIRVPTHAIRNKEAILECNFDLDGEDLYSVKWYKDGNEFFRYEPKRHPPGQKFNLKGMYVIEDESTANSVKLSPVTMLNSGEYRCEVSADAPSFQTVQDSGNMTIVALPDSGPVITGAFNRYKLGDHLRVNCTSGKSKPVADLMWLLNGEEVPHHSLRGPWIVLSDTEGLERRTLGLEFKVRSKHFKGKDMKLECLAMIKPVYAQSQIEVVGNVPWHKPRAGYHHHTTTTTTEAPDYSNANIPDVDSSIVDAIANGTNATSAPSPAPYLQTSTYITLLLLAASLVVIRPIPDILLR